MKVRALIGFCAYGYTVSASEEFIIEDKGQALDLEILGFVERLKSDQ